MQCLEAFVGCLLVFVLLEKAFSFLYPLKKTFKYLFDSCLWKNHVGEEPRSYDDAQL